MERKIGETFEFEGKKIKVTIASNDECIGCILDGKCTIMNKSILGRCGCDYREDGTSVKFVEVQEPKKEKFDPKTLKAFDKVLSRYDGGCWSANLFSHIEEENNKYHGTCSFVCNGSLVKFCIPYNDDTKHLVGTKDEAPEFYRYWED